MEREGRKQINVKKNFYFVAIFVLPILLMLSCSKVGGGTAEEDLNAIDNNDDVLPVINLVKPVANQVYKSGDSIIVEGKVTDNKKLYKGKIFISNSTSGIVVAEQQYETHFLQVMDLRLTYKATVSLATEFTVTVEFEDHGLNKATQTLNVKVNP